MPYAVVEWNSDFPDFLQCQYLARAERRIELSRCVLNLMNLESILLYTNALLLHSSFIRIDGYGILFTAPSGTGKSTQADLWAKYEGADIINGDRAALRSEDGIWTAWGLPYAGTSGIYRNESAPIRTVIVLRQSKMNAIRSLGPAEAMRFIYPELTLHRWEASSVNKAVYLLMDLISHVPVYLLECRPDEDAVQVLKHALNESREVIS